MILYCIAYIGALLLSGRVWYVSSIVSMIPFYWFGLYFLPRVLLRGKVFALTSIVGGLLMVYITYLAGNVATNGLAFYWDRFDILHPEGAKAVNMVARYIVGIMGGIFIIAVLKALMSLVPASSRVASLGAETLRIYYIHGYLIILGTNYFVDISVGNCTLLMATCVIFLISVCIVKLTLLSGMVERLIWGRFQSDWLSSAAIDRK